MLFGVIGAEEGSDGGGGISTTQSSRNGVDLGSQKANHGTVIDSKGEHGADH